ncbi:MAG: hypothetical protein N3B01_07285 [Verrucomicrobiae bacterium]|nr:hypothetical protein [Verrucomicrobiae bacterium]
MISPWFIWGLGAATAGLAALTLLLYWFVVCVVLYLHGARFPTGFVPWRYFRDLLDYKEIVAAKGRVPTLYYVMLFLTWTTILLLLVLIVVLWEYRQAMRLLQRRPW